MLFNSQLFLLFFLPFTLIAFWGAARFVPSGDWRLRALLLFCSWIFYSYWDVRLFPLLLFSISVNYGLVRVIERRPGKTGAWVVAGVVLNLGVLGFFKYFNFFAENIAWITGEEVPHFTIILPLAISFFTFQQISCVVEAAKGTLRHRSALDYALFVSFFPQLIAGPIVRHHQLVPQLQVLPDKTNLADKLSRGILLLCFGLFEKVLIADTLAQIANPLFDASLTNGLAFGEAWLAIFAFGFQIYFDFSGYSNMAIGLGLLFGIELPENFNRPYRAASLIDFWRRWHMTLSAFLRDYLYIPLGGNRHGAARMYLAMMGTMLLGGLWHGAAWTFVIWGGVHGLGLCVNHGWQRTGLRMPAFAGWILVFFFSMMSFAIFRAETFQSMTNILGSAVGFGEGAGTVLVKFTVEQKLGLVAAFISALILPKAVVLARLDVLRRPVFAPAMAVGVVFVILYLGGRVEQDFIYFNF